LNLKEDRDAWKVLWKVKLVKKIVYEHNQNYQAGVGRVFENFSGLIFGNPTHTCYLVYLNFGFRACSKDTKNAKNNELAMFRISCVKNFFYFLHCVS